MFRKLLFCYIVILLLAGCFMFANVVFAQKPPLLNDMGASYDGCGECKGTQTGACKQYCGDYQLNDFVKLIIVASQIILGLVGSLALFAFVYGGIKFLASAGRSEEVTKGKEIIIGAVIGLVIVFVSYTFIGMVFGMLGGDATKKWFEIGWFK